ncbi:MAG: hypothetical protein ACJZ8F_06115 [Candidatus Pelagibacter sp.]
MPIEVNQTETLALSLIGEIPKGEQYMVDRALQQNPNLTKDDIYRIEFEAGTYYGRINSKGVPNGYGILGVGDTAMETNFKNGKISRGAEPSIVSSTGEVVTGKDAVDFKNRTFNNGFDVSVVMSNLIKNIDMNYVVGTLETLSRDIATKNNVAWTPYLSKQFNTIRDLLTMEGKRNEEQQNLLLDTLSTIHVGFFAEFTNISNVLGKNREYIDRYTLIELLVAAQSDFNPIRIDAELRKEMERINNAMNTMDFLWTIGRLTNAETVRSTTAFSVLVANYNVQPEDGIPELTDIRINSNVNLRRNTVGDAVIEGEFNGHFYEMEIDPKTAKLTLSEQGRREFKKDKSKDNDREGGGDGM